MCAESSTDTASQNMRHSAESCLLHCCSVTVSESSAGVSQTGKEIWREVKRRLLTSLVLTTGNMRASNAPFSMWTCSLEADTLEKVNNWFTSTQSKEAQRHAMLTLCLSDHSLQSWVSYYFLASCFSFYCPGKWYIKNWQFSKLALWHLTNPSNPSPIPFSSFPAFLSFTPPSLSNHVSITSAVGHKVLNNVESLGGESEKKKKILFWIISVWAARWRSG